MQLNPIFLSVTPTAVVLLNFSFFAAETSLSTKEVFVICGRFTLTADPETISKTFHVPFDIPHSPRYNIAPGQAVPVIVGEESGRLLKVMRWGLIPHWAKDASMGNKLINARAETVMTKPSFKDSFRYRRRCLVPADSFYEWKREGKKSTPYRIVLSGKEVFAFAGLWDRWDSPEGSVFSFTIITTEASESMKQIHNRMPVILSDEEEYVEWLETGDFRTLRKILHPYEGKLHVYSVSKLVNSPKNDMPELILEERSNRNTRLLSPVNCMPENSKDQKKVRAYIPSSNAARSKKRPCFFFSKTSDVFATIKLIHF